jgi:putative nucleotidyltransferase with HDIG domain
MTPIERGIDIVTGSSLAHTDPLEEVLSRSGAPLTAAERRVEALAGVAFVAACLGLLSVWGTRGPAVGLGAVVAAAFMALAMNVRFDVGPGYTVPTQLAFVGLLFAAPPAIVPPIAAAALVAGTLPQVLRGRMRPTRLLSVIPNAWFAIGAALVVALTGPEIALRDRPAVLLAAFAGQIATDFVVSCARDAGVRRLTLRDAVADAPWVYGVDAALTPVGLLAAGAVHGVAGGVACLVPLVGLLAFFSRERRARMESLVELNRAYRGTALVLGNVIEADDGYTGEHSWGVVRLALDVAAELDLNPGQRRNLEFAALLHDVGKVAIAKDIINKPGRLDPHEWTIIKTHTIEGQRMLDQIGGFMADVGRIVRSHHENVDGTGYPDGLAGETIPVEARIIACCDAFNAMTTTRAYRDAMPVSAAIAEMAAHAGTQFDRDVVAALLRVVDATGDVAALASAA